MFKKYTPFILRYDINFNPNIKFLHTNFISKVSLKPWQELTRKDNTKDNTLIYALD